MKASIIHRCVCAFLLLIFLSTSSFAQQKKPFWHQKKFWIGIAITAVGTGLDHYGTGHAERHGYVEGNPFLRRPNGELNAGKLWAIWGGLNVAAIAFELPKDEKWSWVAFGFRAAYGGASATVGIRNMRLPPLTASQ